MGTRVWCAVGRESVCLSVCTSCLFFSISLYSCCWSILLANGKQHKCCCCITNNNISFHPSARGMATDISIYSTIQTSMYYYTKSTSAFFLPLPTIVYMRMNSSPQCIWWSRLLNIFGDHQDLHRPWIYDSTVHNNSWIQLDICTASGWA